MANWSSVEATLEGVAWIRGLATWFLRVAFIAAVYMSAWEEQV
jgi:hypothetical protein